MKTIAIILLLIIIIILYFLYKNNRDKLIELKKKVNKENKSSFEQLLHMYLNHYSDLKEIIIPFTTIKEIIDILKSNDITYVKVGYEIDAVTLIFGINNKNIVYILIYTVRTKEVYFLKHVNNN